MWRPIRIVCGVIVLLVAGCVLQAPAPFVNYAQSGTTCSSIDPNLISVADEGFEHQSGVVALLYNWDLEKQGDNGVVHIHDLGRESVNALPELGGRVQVIEVLARIRSGRFQFHFGTQPDFSGFFVGFGPDFGELYEADRGGFRRIGNFRYSSAGWQQYRVIFTDHQRIQVCVGQRRVLDVTVKDGPTGNGVALGAGRDTDVYLDNLRLWSTEGEIGGSLCMTAALRKLPPAGHVQVVDQNGEPDIDSTDSIHLDLSRLETEEAPNEIRWYRNGVPLTNARGAELSDQRMRTFDGNPQECSPASSHTDHTIAGYVFTAEAYNNGTLIGRGSATIRSPFYSGEIRSINFHTWDRRLDQSSIIEQALGALVSRTNANWVKITRLFFQKGTFASTGQIISTTDPSFGLTTLSDSLLMHAFNEAHSLGLKIYYAPLLLELGDGFRYSHRFNPPSPEFLQHYHDVIVKQAALAQEAAVELFAVGEELPSLLSNSLFWQHLIADVRQVYHGKLTYQVLACCEGGIENLFDKVWLGNLDYIGLGINFERRGGATDPTIGSLVAAYQKRILVAKQLSQHFKKPILFTEFSLFSSDGGSVSGSRVQVTIPDWQEQADATEAILETIQNQTDWAVGISFHLWPSFAGSPYESGNCCGPNLYLKPAEKVIASWFNPENSSYQMPTSSPSVPDTDGDGIPDAQDCSRTTRASQRRTGVDLAQQETVFCTSLSSHCSLPSVAPLQAEKDTKTLTYRINAHNHTKISYVVSEEQPEKWPLSEPYLGSRSVSLVE